MREIIEIISEVLKELYNKDHILIDRSTKEECINHRFAVALEKIITKRKGEGLDVDVEYNRNVTNEIRLFGNRAGQKRILHTDGENMNWKSIIPDIIVHSRGDNRNNFLCIEAKKLYSTKSETRDVEKIKGLLSDPYNYKYGCLVEYIPEQETFCFVVIRKNLNDYVQERVFVDKKVSH